MSAVRLMYRIVKGGNFIENVGNYRVGNETHDALYDKRLSQLKNELSKGEVSYVGVILFTVGAENQTSTTEVVEEHHRKVEILELNVAAKNAKPVWKTYQPLIFDDLIPAPAYKKKVITKVVI